MNDQEEKRDRVVREAFESRSQLLGYVRALLSDYSAAEDVVQETMLVVFKKFDQFEEGTSMLAWCRSIARIEVLKHRQKKRKDRTLVERLLDDSVDAAFEEFQLQRRKDELEQFQNALARCLTKVSDKARDVLHCRYIDQSSYEKIGELIGMKLEAVRKTLFRTKKQLRNCVESNTKGVH